jgi:hypothetical protein
MGNASSDSGGGNDSSSSCGGGISSEAIDRCVNTITLDNGGSINCRTGEISSHSLNDAIGHTPSNSGLDRNDEDRPTYSSASSYDRQFVKDCNSSFQKGIDKHVNTIDLGNGNSYNLRTREFSFYSLDDVIGNNAVVIDNVKNLKIISPDKKHLMNCKKITDVEYTKLKQKLMNDGWTVIGFAKFHKLMYFIVYLYEEYKLTEMTYCDYEDYIYLMNLLKSDNNTSTYSVAKTITQIPIVKQTTIQAPVVKTSPSVVKTTIQTPVVKTSTLSLFPKTTESINTYQKISTEAYSQYNAGKITACEYLRVSNNAREVYEKYGHLTLTSTQVYLKITEDASKQYKAGKMKPEEFVKICNDAKTNYYTEPVKQSTPVHRQPNSTLNNIGSGYVASAQARVNAVNLATTAVSTTARAVANVATAVGNAYIQGANNIGNYNRMEAQATQQLVSNVASAVGNGASAVGNGFVNPSANSERTNQVLNMVSNAPSAVDLCLSNPRGIGINIATGMLAEVNNSYNERSTTRNMVNGTIGAVGLVAGVVGAPTIATAIGGTALAVEGAELVNNMHNTIIERAPTEVRANMLSDSW